MDHQDFSRHVFPKHVKIFHFHDPQVYKNNTFKNDLDFLGLLLVIWWVQTPEYWFLGAMVMTNKSKNHKTAIFDGFWNSKPTSY